MEKAVENFVLRQQHTDVRSFDLRQATHNRLAVARSIITGHKQQDHHIIKQNNNDKMSFNYTTSERDQARREKVEAMRMGNKSVVRLDRIARERGLSEDETVELWRIVKYWYLSIEEGTDGYDKGKWPSFSRDQITRVISSIKKWSDDHSGDQGDATPRR